MNLEWDKIKSLNPKTPEISTALLDALYNFSTEEYLAKKTSVKNTPEQNTSVKNTSQQ